MKTLIVTDNAMALRLARELDALHGNVDIVQSRSGGLRGLPTVDVLTNASQIAADYGLVMSIHCKQLFPAALFEHVRCVNVHPGLNPYNRGWFPHVFSILNGLPAGVTIHEIDAEIDHGRVIARRECAIESWDTSGSVYAKIMEIERALLLEHFVSIRAGTYDACPVESEGNVNHRRDFVALQELDLDETGTFRELLDRLRALTHAPYRNAYYIDASGTVVYVSVVLDPEMRS